MMSRFAEYALRATVSLAAAPDGAPMTTQQIAAEGHIPPGYLAKVLQVLVRGGIITSQRGVNGGYALARAAGSITLLDVVRLADGSHRIGQCPLGLNEHREMLCPLHRRLDDVVAETERMLAGATIADILAATPAYTGTPGEDCHD